jgi:DNA primase
VRKEGAEAFLERIANSLPLSRFLFDQLSAQVQMDSIDGRAHLAELAKPLLGKLPPGLFRRMMQQHLDELVGISTGSGSTTQPVPAKGRPGAPARAEYAKQRPTPIRMAIAMLLDNPALAHVVDEVEGDWREWDTPGIPLLLQLLEIIQAQPRLNKATLLERWRETPEFAHLNKLARYRFNLPGLDQEAELRDALRKLNRQYRKQFRPTPGNLKPSELSDGLRAELKQRYPGKRSPGKDEE